MRLPEELQDLIFVHELCHLEEMNHGKRFWKLVEKQIPDYNIKNKRLREFTIVK
jgi:predicted metal-dependent hydrolase